MKKIPTIIQSPDHREAEFYDWGEENIKKMFTLLSLHMHKQYSGGKFMGFDTIGFVLSEGRVLLQDPDYLPYDERNGKLEECTILPDSRAQVFISDIDSIPDSVRKFMTAKDRARLHNYSPTQKNTWVDEDTLKEEPC